MTVSPAMNVSSERSRSLWMEERPAEAPPLGSPCTTDIAIIGAGIAGLTTAYLLAKAGREVLVIDAGPLAGGMTARTSAHLSNALDDRWYKLIEKRGARDAAVALQAHTAAIATIESIQAVENIMCDFKRVDGYLSLASGDEEDTLRKERDACHALGFTGVRLEAGHEASLSSDECLVFPDQARFHPLKYLKGLIGAIEAAGGRIVTGRVTKVDNESPATIEVEGGIVVTAAHAVVATNSPINDRLVIHTKQAPYRTYMIAAEVPRSSVHDALMWDTGDPYHYVRVQPMDETTDVLLVGGEDHKTGQADDMETRFTRLEQWTRARFAQVREIRSRWSGQVMESVDYLGYLGRNPDKAENVFVITGDSGMGLTHGTIGARITADAILGRENPWRDVFAPNRVSLKSAPTYTAENLNVAAQMTDHVTQGDVKDEGEIAPGCGAIIRRGLHKIAAYRTPSGEIIERSAVCTHVGCVVAWNDFEKCWDCPCHGSQFAPDGTVLNGPAVSSLASVEPAEKGHHSA